MQEISPNVCFVIILLCVCWDKRLSCQSDHALQVKEQNQSYLVTVVIGDVSVFH